MPIAWCSLTLNSHTYLLTYLDDIQCMHRANICKCNIDELEQAYATFLEKQAAGDMVHLASRTIKCFYIVLY